MRDVAEVSPYGADLTLPLLPSWLSLFSRKTEGPCAVDDISCRPNGDETGKTPAFAQGDFVCPVGMVKEVVKAVGRKVVEKR